MYSCQDGGPCDRADAALRSEREYREKLFSAERIIRELRAENEALKAASREGEDSR